MPGFEGTGKGNQEGLAFFSLLTMLGGGFIEKFSIFSLGVGPYITASVIVQLLSSDLVPLLSR
jgi:preprotein translocase subunit SecY